MAGIWERVKVDAADRISSHLLDAAFVFNATGDFTQQQIIDAINSKIVSPLAGAELTDLGNITSQMSAQGTATLKLVYLEKVRAAMLCAEMNLFNETTFRSILGIS